MLLLVFVGVALWMAQSAAPAPGEVGPEGWRLLAIFAATIVGLMLYPRSGGGVVLLAIAATVVTGVMPITEALAGYSNKAVWLVLAAFIISRALIKTGLARRIALLFIRRFGGTSLGLGYSLIATDVVLASIIPSNAARCGGVILPITRSLAEIYKSRPGATATLLGSFLMSAIYQGDVIASTMFLTGQASNPAAAKFAQDIAGITMSWGKWLLVASVPAAISLTLIPLLLYRLNRPSITHTPAATEFARKELEAMGPLSGQEKLMLGLFVSVCGLWATSSYHGLDTTTVALLGVCGLLVTRVLTWEDAISERRAWDVFIWYGGVVRMGEALGEKGLTGKFADHIGELLPGWGWMAVLVTVVLIYYFSHYGFASITAHMVAMYPVFLALLIASGVPPMLGAFALVYFANLDAGLTHYGTTPAPMLFGVGYLSHTTWWKLGFLCGLANIVIWLGAGLAWWKLLGLW